MPEYLKNARMYSSQATEQIRLTVAEMLTRLEREGEDAIRGYSRDLDGWDPPSLLVDEETIARATFFASQLVARAMIDDARPGVIVNMSSQMGHVGAPRRAVYCATKHAVEGLTKALAVELAQHGIRVVSIAPTFVRTAMTAQQLDDPTIREDLLSQIPLRRFARAEQVAAAVVFVASDHAASITGTSLLLDGGWTAR